MEKKIVLNMYSKFSQKCYQVCDDTKLKLSTSKREKRKNEIKKKNKK